MAEATAAEGEEVEAEEAEEAEAVATNNTNIIINIIPSLIKIVVCLCVHIRTHIGNN